MPAADNWIIFTKASQLVTIALKDDTPACVSCEYTATYDNTEKTSTTTFVINVEQKAYTKPSLAALDKIDQVKKN